MTQTRRALALLVADTGTSEGLVKSAKDLLGRAAAINEYRSAGESVETSDANLAAAVGMNDFVVVLRSRPQPSSKVQVAILAARQRNKPIYALTAQGVSLLVDVQEARSLGDDPERLSAWVDWILARHN